MSVDYAPIAEECRRQELERLDHVFATGVARLLYDNAAYENHQNDPHTEVVGLESVDPIDWLAKALTAEDASRLRTRYLLCDSPEEAARGIAPWAFTKVRYGGGR